MVCAPSALLVSSLFVAGSSYKLALWHEGVVGQAPDEFEAYAAELADFVEYRNIDRVFINLMDPTQFPYAAPDKVAQYFLDKLDPNQEVCAQMYIRPKDSDWSFSPDAPGGKCDEQGNPSTIVPTAKCHGQDGTTTPFEPGCPNAAGQAARYIAAVNAASKGAKISCVGFDGEGLHEYATDPYMCQIGADFKAVGIDDFGFAKGPAVTPAAEHSVSAYPELYWIGELAPDGCHGVTTHAQCVHTMYTRHANNPQAMLDAFSHNFSQYQSDFTKQGTWPMFSVEYYDPDYSTPTCIQRHYDTAGICGTFNGFGTWNWDSFKAYLDLFASTTGAEQIAIYEWQFIPDSWKRTRSPPSPPPLSPCMVAAVNCSVHGMQDCQDYIDKHCPGATGYCRTGNHFCHISVPSSDALAV